MNLSLVECGSLNSAFRKKISFSSLLSPHICVVKGADPIQQLFSLLTAAISRLSAHPGLLRIIHDTERRGEKGVHYITVKC